MTSRMQRFNIYFLASVLVLGAGCVTTKDPEKAKSTSSTSKSKGKKPYSLVRLFIEVNPDGTTFTMPVAVYRANPATFVVNTTPVITEANVASADLVDDAAGFSIMVRMDRRGALQLENTTTAFRNSRLIVYGQWGTESKNDTSTGRWLGAVYISKRLADGVFTFTPDASREEALQFVEGINNTAERFRKNTDK